MTIAASPYVRATVMSPDHALDVVLPTDQAVADLMPGLLALMGADADVGGCVLHTSTGHVIDPERPLAGAMLRDGVVLRLVAEQEAPTEPIVSDLLDLLEAEPPRSRWSTQAQQWTLACLGTSVLSLAGGLWVTGGAQPWPRLAIIAIAALAFSAVSASMGRRELAWVSAGIALLAANLAVMLGSPTSVLAGAWGAAVVLGAIAATGWCQGRWRSTLMAAVIWGALVGAAGLSWLSVEDVAVTSAIVATLSSLILGMLPRAALGVSGLLTTDAQVGVGRVMARQDARVLVDHAHHCLAGAVAICAFGYATAGFGLALTAGLSPSALGLLAATLVSWLARIRHFPLITQRASICGAVLVVGAGLAIGVVAADPDLTPWVMTICGAVGVCVVAAGSMNLSSVAAALTRRWVQRVETIAVVATVPCLIGLLGVYADLLETF